MTGISNLWTLAVLFAAAGVSGCSTLGGAGPSTSAVRGSAEQVYDTSFIQVVELNASVNNALSAHASSSSFAEVFGEGEVSGTLVGAGDVLDIAIWEAPPAVLFGIGAVGGRPGAGADIAANTDIPQQQVGEDGRVTVPFVGRIHVLGRPTSEIERTIVARLQGRANDPQVVVRLVDNQSRAVTVLGEVRSSGRMVLSGRGERLLDAIAHAGGTREAVEQSTIQLARGSIQAAMSLGHVIAEPDQNVRLQPNDVITVQHKPYSFVALGAVSSNSEVPFEGRGISLAEALGRAGGLNDQRADVKGVFVFRMEREEIAEGLIEEDSTVTQDGRVPVVYSLRMDDGASLFAMQDFVMRDGDVLYVSTAPGVELERFLSTISRTAFSIVATGNAIDGQ